MKVEKNGQKNYDSDNCNQAVNIKNLLDYTKQFSKKMGTNQLFFLDTSLSAEERDDQAVYNKGFAQERFCLGHLQCECWDSSNRYSSFGGLDNELLPNIKVGITFDLDSDANLI